MGRYCPMPFIGLETRSDAKVNPCCMWVGDSVGDVRSDRISNIWNGEAIERIREQFRNGEEPLECSSCWNAEASGSKSKRQFDLDQWSHHEQYKVLENPVYLDLKLGSICNIKCRTCSTHNSHKWHDDEVSVFGKPHAVSYINWVDERSTFWKDIQELAPTLEYIDITGGEPFIVKPQWELLQYLIDHDHAKNIWIHYNTNGTIMPTRQQLDLWKEFNWVGVTFSLDGIGDRFEYMRHPARWNEVVITFETLLQESNLFIGVNYTVSILNVMYMKEFSDWLDTYKDTAHHEIAMRWNLLHHPRHYCITNIPDELKLVIEDNIPDESVKNFMINTACNRIDYENFLDINSRIDKLREENFSNTFSELHEIMNTSEFKYDE